MSVVTTVMYASYINTWTKYATNNALDLRWLGNIVVRLCKYGRQAFPVAGPTVWNSLPADMWVLECSADSYRQSLKPLFSQY